MTERRGGAVPESRSGARTAARTAGTACWAAVRTTAAAPELAAIQLAWAAVTASVSLATVALTVAAYRQAGAGGVALAVVLRALPSVVTGPLIALWMRRATPYSLMAVAAAAGALAAGASAASVGSLPALVGCGLVMTVAARSFRTAQLAVLPRVTRGLRQLTAANVMCTAVDGLGVLLGPVVAAACIALAGPVAAFVAAAGLLLLGSGRMLVLRLSAGRPADPLPPFEGSRDGPRPSLLLLLRLPVPRLVLGLLLPQAALSGALRVLYAPVSDTLGGGDAAVGLLTSAFGVGGLLASLCMFALAGSSRLGMLVAAGLSLWAVPLVLVSGAPDLPAALVLLAAVGAGNAVFDVASITLLQRGVPDPLLGNAFALRQTLSVLASCAGAAVAAPVADAAGTRWALVALALPVCLLVLVVLPGLHRLDRTLGGPAGGVALLRALPAFELLPGPELERLALRLRRQDAGEGEVVVRQGEAGSSYWVVEAGTLSVLVDGAEVGRLGPGDAFGEIALLRDVPRTASVVARSDVVLQALEREDFLAAMASPAVLATWDAVVDARLDRAAPAARQGDERA
ncbi:Cyclic nucleotide-binding domain-containing protein [Motilibacter peucedani]|uniref:Cyclic nucleotide-binding domain-containing protein n=1 Tax=Motilibacter peucedani TaxID=598650 RepID=A0A420XK03_9ACTN|nr:cyclic nucleotide-binding domain-containing protein [Motilibacter peucedani]RKS67950.1 Cyclic nucleotide-binding domain-containing protein [Motilibacter peucedani]